MKKKPTHYAGCDRATEINNFDTWYPTACGLDSDRIQLTDQYKHVTCKNCLKVLVIKPDREMDFTEQNW